MDGSATPLAERRQAGADFVALLCDQHTVGYQCPTGELGELLGELAQIRAFCDAQLAAVVADAEQRGVVEASQCASTAQWVAQYAWHVRRDAPRIAKAAKLLRRPELADVADSVLTADLDLGTAAAVAAEYDKLLPDLIDEAKPVILEQLLSVGADHGPVGVRQLTQQILARWGKDGEFEKHQQRCRRQIELSAGRETSPGVWDYRFTGDNEAHAILEAAIGPLSAPRTVKDEHGHTVQCDDRPVGRRRGEALIEALRNSVTVTDPVTGRASANPKAVLMVTMDYDALAAHYGSATVLGTRAAGCPLAPDTVRKLACEAMIIPVVLGKDGQILDQGRGQRLFDIHQVRALWLRDGHCTFPDCDAPAAWCHGHHLVHVFDGGPTDLSNAALLCARHHTIVHRDRLAGMVTDHGVEWDLRPGSYRPAGRQTAPAEQPPEAGSPFRRPGNRTDPARPRSNRPNESGAARRTSASNPATNQIRRT